MYSGELSPGGREMMTSGGERHRARTPDTPGHESEINSIQDYLYRAFYRCKATSQEIKFLK